MYVKSEPKPFASLSSGLLARKGGARPAMRPQGFGQLGGNLEDLGWNDMGFEPPKPVAVDRDDQQDGFGEPVVEHPALNGHAGLTPVHSPVHTQQAEIAGRLKAEPANEEEAEDSAEFCEPQSELREQPVARAPIAEAPVAVAAVAPAAAPAPRRSSKSRAAPGSKGKAAFTLRLDPERHLKLRLACALNARSAQLLVTDALDQFLSDMPELEAMAERAQRKG
jgi:hypothetical protein